MHHTASVFSKCAINIYCENLKCSYQGRTKTLSKCYKSVVRKKLGYLWIIIFCQSLFKATIVLGLRIAIETNSPARIADPSITDVRSYKSIHIDLHTRFFSLPPPRLPIILPILQAVSIATKVGANPNATSIKELNKSTITS